MASYSEAIYFSMVTVTSLGYGDVTLSSEWRLLAGMEALVGIVVVGITIALLVTVIQQGFGARDDQGLSP